MATKAFTINRGGRAQDVVVSAGSATGTDQIVLNVDRTNMTRGEFDNAMAELLRAIRQGPWPAS